MSRWNLMRRLLESFRYAFAGVGFLLRSQPNARIHLVITLAVVALGLWVGLPLRDWAVIVVTTGVVFAAEAFNTALEATLDRTSPEFHPLTKVAKDVGAAAVLMAAFAAVVVGALILGPPLWQRILDLLS